MELSEKELLNRLRRYCALQERCEQQVRAKIREKSTDSNLENKIIKTLIAENFLNEQRFSSLYVRSKFNQKDWGRNKIRQKLRLLGIPEPLISAGLLEIEQDDYERKLTRLVADKYRKLKRDLKAEQKRFKLMNSLLSKGYERDLIYQRIKHLK